MLFHLTVAQNCKTNVILSFGYCVEINALINKFFCYIGIHAVNVILNFLVSVINWLNKQITETQLHSQRGHGMFEMASSSLVSSKAPPSTVRIQLRNILSFCYSWLARHSGTMSVQTLFGIKYYTPDLLLSFCGFWWVGSFTHSHSLSLSLLSCVWWVCYSLFHCHLSYSTMSAGHLHVIVARVLYHQQHLYM